MKKLNTKGIAHYLIPLVIVIGVAAVGTYMLVASHASNTMQLAGDGKAAKKSVVSGSGKVHTVTDLETAVFCEKSCGKLTSASIGGKKANLKCSGRYDSCTIALRVNGNQNGKKLKVKVYAGNRVVAGGNIKFY